MFFHIKIPGPYGPESEIETMREYKTVRAHRFDNASYGQHLADYIVVEHSTGIGLESEYMLMAGPIKNKVMGGFVHGLKKKEEFGNRKVAVHQIANNVFVANTQFTTPFGYRTSRYISRNQNY